MLQNNTDTRFPQSFFYPLYKQFEQDFFLKLKQAVRDHYHFHGNKEVKETFLKLILSLQMVKNYRQPYRTIRNNLQPNVQLAPLNNNLSRQDLAINYSWAIWTRDKIMGKLAEKLQQQPLILIGSDSDYDQFILRYLISIWLVDWEGPLFAILQDTAKQQADLPRLNHILSLWDFTDIFSDY